MSEHEASRLVAWSQELRRVHSRVREALWDASDRSAPPEELALHLEGIAAIMESHFRYEERQLLTVLDTLHLEAAPGIVLGPL